MIHGIDTRLLVAAEVAEHPDHSAARATLAAVGGQGFVAENLPCLRETQRFLKILKFEPIFGELGWIRIRVSSADTKKAASSFATKREIYRFDGS